MTQWKKHLFFAMKLAQQNLSHSYAEVTPKTGMNLISPQILDTFRKLRSFRKCDKGMVMTPEDETYYTTQYKEVFRMYVETEYCGKHRGVLVNKLENIPSGNFVHSTMASGSGQSLFAPYDLSSDDEECLMPNNVAEMTHRHSD